MTEASEIARRYIDAFDEMIARPPDPPGFRPTTGEYAADHEQVALDARVSDAIGEVMDVLKGDDDAQAVSLGVELILLGSGSTRRMGYLTSGGPVSDLLDHPVRGPMLRDHPDPTVRYAVRSYDYIKEYLRDEYLRKKRRQP